MEQLGYSSGEDYSRTRAFANDLRRKYSTDWSFIIFVIDARNDAEESIVDHSGIAWAYVGGPYMVIPNKCAGWDFHNIWRIVAHETGHIFNALDEYDTVQRITAAKISDANMTPGHIPADALCMMRTNDPVLCDNTLRQIGWLDHNVDGIYDRDEYVYSSRFHSLKLTFEPGSTHKHKLLFYENFNQKSDWFEDANNFVLNGRYYMYDSIYGSSTWPERSYDDFTATVKTHWVQGSAASGYGLMVRAKTATDGYIFFINHHGQFSFGKYVNSNWEYLEPWSHSDVIRISGENTLTARCIGNHFTLFINGIRVTEVYDDTFIYGNVGVTVLPDVQASFDDLYIHSR